MIRNDSLNHVTFFLFLTHISQRNKRKNKKERISCTLGVELALYTSVQSLRTDDMQ